MKQSDILKIIDARITHTNKRHLAPQNAKEIRNAILNELEEIHSQISATEESGGFQLTLRGFKTKAQVRAFIDWYDGEGEQDACVWFFRRMDEGKIDVDMMPVDTGTPYVWEGNTLVAKLDIPG